VIFTAHVTEVTGRYAELIARAALLANGWTVHTSDTDEAYDILATDPLSGGHYRIQVKTIRQRTDRGNELVVYAKKGNGEVYTKADADYILGVLANNGTTPRVFMLENRSLTEYWASEAKASERWIELDVACDREAFTAVSAV